MEKEFLNLMECFCDEKLTGEIKRSPSMEAYVEELNKTLNPKGTEKNQLLANKVCPIAASGEKFKYVIFGFNPHDDGDIEEINDIKTWEDMAAYHTRINKDESNTFKRVIEEKVVTYYRNIGILIESLHNKKLVEWKADFVGNLKKEEVAEKYMKIITERPIAVVELIPFASKSFEGLSKRKLSKLLEKGSRYERYFSRLLEIIKERTCDDGWIICDGSNICEAFEYMCGKESEHGELKLLLDRSDRKYAVYSLGKHKILFFRNAIRKRGLLNSYEQIKRMIEDVTREEY